MLTTKLSNEELNTNNLTGIMCNHRLIPVNIDPMTPGYQCVDCGRFFEAYVSSNVVDDELH